MSGNVLDPDHPRVAPALDRKPDTSLADRRERRSRRPDENRHREEVIREVLTREGERLSQEVIRKLTSDLGVSRATAYRMIKTFRSCGAVTAPMTRPVGRPKGARVLDSTRETLIRDVIETFYLQPSRPKFSQLVREIAKRCLKERLPAPNWRTIKARVHDIDIQTRTRRRSETE
ncbi:transposase [Methylosinus sp. Ce-a6]|uniref:transposase n=1 Tax=Methylosinus sp. Ce-a6 TaxID=2172005 RepID=UPI00135CF3F3|nr:transposase [Methylosinus sp. Ce-a6]